MRIKVYSVVLLALLVFTLSYRVTSAEFSWSDKGLTETFGEAVESGKLLLVLASKDITSDFSKEVTLIIENEDNNAVSGSFVGVRLVGEKAEKFKKNYGIEELPAFVALKPSGELVWQYDPSENLVDSLIDLIVASVRPLKLPQIQQFMDLAAQKLSTGATVDASLLQKIALHSLELLLEEANKTSKSKKEEDPLRADPQAGQGKNQEQQSSGSGESPSEEGERYGGSPDNVAYNGGNTSTSAEWGKLPPKLREDVADTSAEEIPPSYREIVEEYFKSLMR